ncbi:MAG: Zn-dependent alcohol dehydrogenase, partial [Ktedonobacteraceae bacterium]|nr:Zn-dependent alcohol dehydrogenase [Ktedonobacteraceae bacterium]
MRAAVCYEPGEPLRVEEIMIDPPQSGEVKVRVRATAICHSDIFLVRGGWPTKLPVLAGHEASGIVEEIGSGVTAVKPGDSVVISLLRSCGTCFYCRSGLSNHCDGAFALLTESRLRNGQGDTIYQGIRTGAFAEYVVVDQSQAVRIPPEIAPDRAALLACGVITGVGAVVNTAQVRPGSSVVVIGAGGVGLNAIQGAALAGASHIIALDIVEMKLLAAKHFGATHTLQAQRSDVQQIVQDLTGGRGADYVFITVGSAPAVTQGLSLLRRAGTLVLVGMPQTAATVPLPVADTAEYGYRILGSFVGATRPHVDIPWQVDLYQQGRLKLDELITAHYPLEQINEAIEAVE